MTTDFKRLGKRGSYRLGKLRAQGIKTTGPPPPFQPSFARSYRRGPAPAWLLGLLAGALVIWWGAALGWWFLPFAVGLTAGLANRIAGWRPKIALPTVALMAAAGWGIALLWQVVHDHQPDGAVARVIAALGGLPAYAATGVLATLLVAVAQSLAGYWLGRAVTPWPGD